MQKVLVMRIVSFFIFFLLLLLGCNEASEEGRIISVTIEPQRYFAEQIGGDKFTIHTVVAAGQSPETYDPSPRQMAKIGKSEAYLQIGHIGFEQAWMNNIRENNKGLQVFDLSKGFKLIETEEECDHDHEGHEGHAHHHHGGVDPHIWSCIEGARHVAAKTMEAFCELDPENRDFYFANFEKVMARIDSTDKAVLDLISPLSDRTFIIYHPALTYFAKEFNLTQLCIEMDGKEPSPALLKQLVRTAVENKAKVVFIQEEFDKKNAELIAKETGCRLVTINPLSYNWNEEMIRIAKALANE